MVRHTGFLATLAGLGLMLAPASGCSPSAITDTTTHPADPQAPAGAAAPEVADAPDQPAPDAHADHGAHAAHGAHADHGAHAAHGAHAGHDAHADHGAHAAHGAHADHGAHGGAGTPADATEPMTHDHGAHAHARHGAQAPSPQPEQSAEVLLAAEQDAYQRAKPVFDKYCAKCHSSAGKKAREATLAHFSMDTYQFGGHHETEMGEVIRTVLGVTGKRPTMPKDQPGIVQGDELALLVAWSEAFDKSHAAGLHQHGGAHGAGHQHGAASEPSDEHQHGAEKKPAKAPARGSDKKKPAPEKKPDATHQHGKEHEGHQHGQHDHGKGHDHGHH